MKKRIQKIARYAFVSSFVLVQIFLTFPGVASASLYPSVPPEFVMKWGSAGAGDGQLSNPRGITIDSEGNVYVAETFNHRVQKFDSSGNFLIKWGSLAELAGPYGVAVDSTGSVYVVEGTFFGVGTPRVQKFDSSGNLLMTWGSEGAGDGQFTEPQGLAIDDNDVVYVADMGNHRIQKFDTAGNFLGKWGTNGIGDGQFSQPQNVAVASDGSVYVADMGNHRIQKFDSNGVFISKWGANGSGNGQFNNPRSVTIDTVGNVYVADFSNHRIQKFDSDGTFLTTWGSHGAGDGQFNNPRDVAVDESGKLYVADSGNARIQVFTYPPLIAETTLANAENEAPILLQTPTETSNITCSNVLAEPSQSSRDPTYTYPLGLVDFCFDTTEQNNAVMLTFVTDLKPHEVIARKYNTTTNTYFTIEDAVVTQTTYNSQPALQLTYTIEDNGVLDLDPAIGKVRDPVGLAVVEDESGGSTGGGTNEGGNTGGAQNLANTGDPLLLVGLLAMIGIGGGILMLRKQIQREG